MPKKLLYAMRHCETLFNVQHKTQGWCDSPITPRGVEQCKIVGELLAQRGIAFDHFYSSTSERCCDTMELVCQAAFSEVKPYRRLKGLRECGFGIFEGKDDFCEPKFSDLRGAIMKAGGGESNEEIIERVEACLASIMADPDTQNAFVVSSGGALRRFFMKHQETARATFVENTNCMTYVYEWDDGVFSCTEIITPDFSSLPESGVPYRWELSDEELRAVVTG